jgi:hypothetical protein
MNHLLRSRDRRAERHPFHRFFPVIRHDKAKMLLREQERIPEHAKCSRCRVHIAFRGGDLLYKIFAAAQRTFRVLRYRRAAATTNWFM